MRLYPFIDIAVLPEVRESFSRGDALAVLTEDAAEIIWVNGPGASFFGSFAIEDLIGEPAPLQAQARRQLRAAGSGVSPRPLLLRVDRGIGARQLAVKARQVELPDGVTAILLIAPGDGPSQAITGFSDEKAVAALLDEKGRHVASDPRLAEINPSPEDILFLRSRLDSEGATSVKQRIGTDWGRVPAALGDLGGSPRHFILFLFLEPASAKDEASPPQSSEDDEDAAGRTEAPLRFLWETDADNRFTIVSESFKRLVGTTGAIEGREFHIVMERLGMDPDHRLDGLMKRRDTWSGRSVDWPIAGTPNAVPTDLAALPLYDRERHFLGYRGYGVAHPDRISPDPEQRGLLFAKGWPDGSRTGDGPQHPASQTQAAAEAQAETQAEPPAMAPAPLRRRSDHSALDRRSRRTLTDAETIAFQSIGAHLREESAKTLPAEESEAKSAPDKRTRAAEERSDLLLSDEVSEPVVEDDDRQTAPTTREAELVDEVSSPPTLSTGDADLEQAGDEAARLAIEAMGWQRSNRLAPEVLARISGLDRQRNVEATSDDGAEDAETSLSEESEGSAESAAVETSPSPDPDYGSAEPAADAAETNENASHSGVPLLTDDGMVADEAAGDAASAVGMSGEDLGVAPVEEPAAEHISEETEAQGDATSDPQVTPSPARSTHLTPSALARLPIASLVLDHGKIAYASRSLLTLTAYRDVATIEESGGFAALFDEAASADGDRRGGPPVQMVKSDGSVVPINAQMQAIGWNEGSALLFAFMPLPGSEEDQADDTPQIEAQDQQAETYAAATDLISEEEAERRVEETAAPLRRHVEELTAILDTATDGVVLLTPEGDIRAMNRSSEALFGDDAESLRDRPFRQLFAYESRLTIDAYLASLRESERASVLNDGREVIGKEKGGGFIPLFITLGKLPANGGYCVVLRDITPWKRVENELRQARRAAEDASAQKTEFLARVSHEVRTPLNAIIGFSELMISERFGPVGNPRYRDYLRDIQKSGNHVLDLVNDLLDISKIEGGHQEMEYEAIGLNEVVADAVAMLQPQANAERVIIRTSLSSGLPDVVADPRSIKQIAINLLTNAVKFTSAGGQVIVSTGPNRDGSVALRFRDSGIGMSEEDISQALKPFKQISTLRRTRRDGTGLGLPLTKALVEANKARFSIESEPNIGTLVEVTFPPERVLT
ncbi:ATP-binding protein [Notoacmeibacter ruber]|uniref:histidine kinase n=1 Tax=Notoacmeibacter ruber TaxID=2670375 RepID=A0A3L7JCF5_9HYPH|nr:ATP-binding protein [Notoacmeibacter ruber]RLQ87241.1 PAS domain S-box protein [Notoacmeibacter ruber]